MKYLLVPVLLFTCAIAAAQVFKRVGPDGKAYFTDQPGADARPIEVAPAQTISLPPVPEATQDNGAATESAAPAYTAFTIVSPTSGEEIRANNGNVSVQLALQPGLKPGHMIKLMLDGEDGETIKPGGGLTIALSNLSRGLHSVEARVVDADGKTLIQTTVVSFQVLRAALGSR